MNNPKVNLFLGYVLIVCGIIISLTRLASIMNLFGQEKVGSTSTSVFGLIFVILGVVTIRWARKNN
jgi:uncharacterized membrane protein